MTDSTQKRTERPLSPHLQVYSWQLTMITSIMHRFTGVVSSVGLFVLVALIYGLAFNPDLYYLISGFFGTIFGMLVLTGFAAAMSYHLCNGVRHLVFDTGRMLTLKEAYTAGYIVLGMTAIMTLALACVIWCKGF